MAPIRKAFNSENLWFCENTDGEIFAKSLIGEWLIFENDQENVSAGPELSLHLEAFYGLYYGQEFTLTAKESSDAECKADKQVHTSQNFRVVESQRNLCQNRETNEKSNETSGAEVKLETDHASACSNQDVLSINYPEDLDTCENISVEEIFPRVSEVKIIDQEVQQLGQDQSKQCQSMSLTDVSSDPELRSWSRVLADNLPECVTKTIKKYKIKKVYHELQEALQNLYKADVHWINLIPWRNLELPRHYWFSLSIAKRDKTTGNVEGNEFCYANNIFVSCAPADRVAVLGRPGFGKTALLSHLAQAWALEDNTLDKFGLCMKYQLKDMIIELLEESIIKCCIRLLSKFKVYDINTIKSVLEYESQSSLLLFDGYDELSELDKQHFHHFLLTNFLFNKFTIVVSCRFGLSSNISKMFNQYASINGLSLLRLQELVCYHHTETAFNNFRLRFANTSSIHYLSEISPFLQYYVWKAFMKRNLQMKNIKIFDVLQNAMTMFASDNCTNLLIRDFPEIYIIFLQLGRLFYKMLVDGCITFQECKLKSWLGKSFEFAVQSGLIYLLETNGRLWSASSKLFLVFFATYYLRTKWNEMTTVAAKTKFIKNIFCCNLQGEYIVTHQNLHFVGVLPEIVLNFGRQNSLEKAYFDMYYDVERIEYSPAFDSVNLLVRLSERFLKRFQFTKKSAEKHSTEITNLEQVFQVYLNALSLTDFVVKYSFYSNAYEVKQFLKVNVETSIPENYVLVAVFQANMNSETDKGYIELLFSEVNTVFNFLQVVLSSNFPGISLPSHCGSITFEEFLNMLVCAICSCFQKKKVLIHCGNKLEEERWKPIKTDWSMLVKPKSQTQSSGVHILRYNFYPNEYTDETSEFYDRDWLLDHSKEFLEIIKSNCGKMECPILRLNFS